MSGLREADLNLVTSCEHVREIGNRTAQLVVFEIEESIDQPATVQGERKLGQRWRFDLAAAIGLWYLVVKISGVDVEDFSNPHHRGRAQSVDALLVFFESAGTIPQVSQPVPLGSFSS
jgi:hypothetical protein